MEQRVKYETFGDWIRHWRQREGLTQAELAERVGVDRTYINKIERGKVEMPQFELRQRLGEWLGFNDDDLRGVGFLQDSVPEDETVILRLERSAAEAIAGMAESDAGGKVLFSHENLQFLAEIAKEARSWAADRRQAFLDSLKHAPMPGIAETPGTYDPDDALSRIAAVLAVLPRQQDIDEVVKWVEFYRTLVEDRNRVVTTAPDDEFLTTFYQPSPKGPEEW